jgi:16S rRNA (guanine527-N7)-methyltransferase
MIERIRESFLKEGFDLSELQIKQLNEFKNLLIYWNNKMNLTAIDDDEGVLYKHFIDSANILKTEWIKDNLKILDIGSGAGFPGIVIKILRPEVDIILLDSTAKRVNFLQTVIDKLELKNIKAIHGRAEELAQKREYREKFNIVTSRAVANLSMLLELSIPFISVKGFFIPMKGSNYLEEVSVSKNAFIKLDSKLVDTYSYKLVEQDRYILKIVKNKSTKKIFPRKFGVIKKKPL